MPLLQSLPWCDPLEMAAGVAALPQQRHWVFLYSATQANASGRFSFLAYNLHTLIEGKDISQFETQLSANRSRYDNAWFGYLGYGLKHCMESLPCDQPHWFGAPPLTMMQFSTIIVFNHELRQIDVWGTSPFTPPPYINYPLDSPPPSIAKLRSNMTKEQYFRHVESIIDRIHVGDLYQANLTRKFMGRFDTPPHPFSLFTSLCRKSPAAYSAFMRLGDRYVLSSSPELFVKIDSSGAITTRPIKGTAPRHADPAIDAKLREELKNNSKDQAENLMIVDLMRNDLAKSCVAGSITVPELFTLTSHSNVHHLSSQITGQKRNNCSALESIMHCFPPGSMTGAPKIRAMELCSQLEWLERGIYSGAIGWFGGDGACELSVVIRTLLIHCMQWEFQVGGGIVADSIPTHELQETIEKSKGILSVLGIEAEALLAL